MEKIHTHNGLNYTVEPSLMPWEVWDVVFWDAAGSMQVTYVASTNADTLQEAYDYGWHIADNLATAIQHQLQSDLETICNAAHDFDD